MRHLVIGASGLIGSYICNELQRQGEAVVGTFYERNVQHLLPCDICNKDAVERLLKDIHPDVVYLVAAATNVDVCEGNPSAAARINVDAVEHIIKVVPASVKLVFLSTGYVFDGAYSSSMWHEYDVCNPINVYGRQKLQAENYIRSIDSGNWLIIRAVHVYGLEATAKNFGMRVVMTLRNNQSIRASSREFGTPVHAYDVAKLAISPVCGIRHVVGPASSRFQFANRLAQLFRLPTGLIVEGDRVGGAPRPQNCILASRFLQCNHDGLVRFLREAY